MANQPKEYKPGEVVEMTVKVLVAKDMGDHGGPNMWNLYIRRPSDNFPMSVQWMDAGNVERLLDIKLPRYTQSRGKIKPAKA